MPGSKSPRPSIESQLRFELLMELYDKGRGLNAKERIGAISKFLAFSQPGAEKQVNWGFWFKEDRAERIVNALHWGLDQLREGKPFTRTGPEIPLFDDEIESFKDGILWDRARGQVTRVGSRDPRHLFLTRVFELLTEIAPWLRFCQRDDCRRFFLFQRPKQIYCSDVCAQRVRMVRFLAQRSAPVLAHSGVKQK